MDTLKDYHTAPPSEILLKVIIGLSYLQQIPLRIEILSWQDIRTHLSLGIYLYYA